MFHHSPLRSSDSFLDEPTGYCAGYAQVNAKCMRCRMAGKCAPMRMMMADRACDDGSEAIGYTADNAIRNATREHNIPDTYAVVTGGPRSYRRFTTATMAAANRATRHNENRRTCADEYEGRQEPNRKWENGHAPTVSIGRSNKRERLEMCQPGVSEGISCSMMLTNRIRCIRDECSMNEGAYNPLQFGNWGNATGYTAYELWRDRITWHSGPICRNIGGSQSYRQFVTAAITDMNRATDCNVNKRTRNGGQRGPDQGWRMNMLLMLCTIGKCTGFRGSSDPQRR